MAFLCYVRIATVTPLLFGAIMKKNKSLPNTVPAISPSDTKKRLLMTNLVGGETLDKGRSTSWVSQGEEGWPRFQHTPQTGVQFRAKGSSVSGIPHVMCQGCR